MSNHLRIRISFLGGVANGRNPTGSCIFIEINKGKQKILGFIDTGMWQGNGDTYGKNLLLPPQLDKLDFVILTHSHIDHVGRLPYFVKNGFRGKIFCTEPTAQLLNPMLMDSAKIVQAEAKTRKIKTQKYKKEGGKLHFQRSQKGFIFFDKVIIVFLEYCC